MIEATPFVAQAGLADDPMVRETFVFAGKAVIIYFSALVMIRIGKTRFLGKNTAFDIILGIMVGSVLARAINGGAPIVGTIVAAAVLIALHYLLSHLALHSDLVGRFAKGRADRIIEDGRLDKQQMHRHLLTERDLHENLRLNGKTHRVENIAEAYFERNGQISVIPKEHGNGRGSGPSSPRSRPTARATQPPRP